VNGAAERVGERKGRTNGPVGRGGCLGGRSMRGTGEGSIKRGEKKERDFDASVALKKGDPIQPNADLKSGQTLRKRTHKKKEKARRKKKRTSGEVLRRKELPIARDRRETTTAMKEKKKRLRITGPPFPYSPYLEEKKGGRTPSLEKEKNHSPLKLVPGKGDREREKGLSPADRKVLHFAE